MTKKLGVIGGLGPLATAYYYELVTKMTEVTCDQDHIEILIHSVPQIPDRTAFILGESHQSPLPEMQRIGQALVEAGAEVIAIPCITAHYFHEELTKEIKAPVIHLVRESVSYLKERGKKRVGILATDGTIRSGLFQQELKSHGMEAVIPSKEAQADVMHLIYQNIKLGLEPEMERFERVGNFLRAKGAEVMILGCTELSLIKRDQKIGANYLDALEVLAMQSVKQCGATVKQEYQELITKSRKPLSSPEEA